MNTEDHLDALREVLCTQALAAAATAGIPYLRLPNATGDTPKSGIWANFWYRTGKTRSSVGGNNQYECTAGVLQFDLMIPENTGDGPGIRAGRLLRRHFSGRQFLVGNHGYVNMDPVSVEQTTPQSAQQTAPGGALRSWYRIIVDGTFEYHHKDPNPLPFRVG